MDEIEKQIRQKEELLEKAKKKPDNVLNQFSIEIEILRLKLHVCNDKKKDKSRDFIRTLIAGAVGATLTALLGYLMSKDPLKMVIRESPTQKIQIVYDTIFLKAPILNQDTSFVRIVK